MIHYGMNLEAAGVLEVGEQWSSHSARCLLGWVTDSSVVTDPSLVIYHAAAETDPVVTLPTFPVIFRDPEVIDLDPVTVDGQVTCCVRGMCDLGLESGPGEVRLRAGRRNHRLDPIHILTTGDDPLSQDSESSTLQVANGTI